jgi:hypothetical protein
LTTRVIDRMSNPLHNYFHAKTVAEIATTGDVVTVKTSQTVEHAIRVRDREVRCSVLRLC